MYNIFMAEAPSLPDDKMESPTKTSGSPPKDAEGLLRHILKNAVGLNASSIHFEPTENELRVRFRVMGALFEQESIPVAQRMGIERLIRKVSHMDEDDVVHPQEGPFRYQLENDTNVTGHVSVLPTIHGPKQVLTISHGDGVMTLGQIGMSPKQTDLVRNMLDEEGSLLLVAGPWASGKSATLYAIAADCANEAMSVATLEDPVEIMLPGITQTQVSPRDGLTFASGMRAILRQDPNIIALGELADAAEATIAMEACLQGAHRVISCLHTRNGVESILWLLNAGLDPVKLSKSLSGIIVQRLVRKVCKGCAKPAKLRPKTIEAIGFPIDADGGWLQGQGCVSCNGSGYNGKTAIFEIIPIGDALKEVIEQNPSELLLKKALRAQKVRTLRRAGLIRAKAGITSVAEVLRVTS
jgi:type II secretory ATPase GspE/PulE/Tfp pilus assembly ATPase PilB-like protein